MSFLLIAAGETGRENRIDCQNKSCWCREAHRSSLPPLLEVKCVLVAFAFFSVRLSNAMEIVGSDAFSSPCNRNFRVELDSRRMLSNEIQNCPSVFRWAVSSTKM
eukprot:749350-Hanusia_phi.AAC.2